MNKTFDISVTKQFYFNVKFSYSPQKEDLIYKYSNIEFLCQNNYFNYKSISCKLPTHFELFPPNTIKYEYDIYSNLSCLNRLYIGRITIEDPYLVEIIDANNLTEISKNIDKTYDASQKIKNFTIDMINYYYWFASFAYCDDDYIESGQCCKEEILTDWEVISHKEYAYNLRYYLDLIGNNENYDYVKMKARVNKIEEVDLDSLKCHLYNYAILKSSKYKKYIFTFPGSTNFNELYSEIIYSDLVQFEEGDINIKVNKLFLLIFNLTKNDIFSEEILKDIKKNKDYQIIFIGHSFGGAIATIASYYFAKNKLIENEPILITFGQPRVGNENFARDYMKIITKVFRIERYNDYVSMLPPIKKFEDNEVIKILKLFKDLKDVKGDADNAIDIYQLFGLISESVETGNWELAALFILKKFATDILSSFAGFIDDSIYERFRMITYGYCHIGGLYVINGDSNKFYHCKDFYNEEINSPYCKNWEIDFGKLNHFEDFHKNNNYFTKKQSIKERCQERKYGMVMVFA